MSADFCYTESPEYILKKEYTEKPDIEKLFYIGAHRWKEAKKCLHIKKASAWRWKELPQLNNIFYF